MKKGVIIAVVALSTSFAIYAGVSALEGSAKAETKCCPKDIHQRQLTLIVF